MPSFLSYGKMKRIKCQMSRYDPESPALYKFGNFIWKKNSFNHAIDTLKKGILLDPKSAAGYTNLGIIYCQIGNIKKGMENISKALELEPNNEIVIKNYEMCKNLLRSKHK